MLEETKASERTAVRARQHGFELQVEAITQRDTNSKRALADVLELYASVEARASTVIKEEENLNMCARQVN
jgi:hypothetical protein